MMDKKILLIGINSKYIHSNLAIYSLRAYASEFEDSLQTVEYTINQEISFILSDIYQKRPDVVAFSCYIWNIEIVKKLVFEISKLMPNVPIWLGGPEVSYDYENLLLKYPMITGLIIGEGEKVFARLCDFYCKNHEPEDLYDIEGLCINGAIAKYRPAKELLHMDDLPFCYEIMEDQDNRIVYYESSRGCPFSCSYCLSSVDKKLRFKSLSKVIKELRIFMDKKVKLVKFVDRTFNCNEERTLAIWEFLLENYNGCTKFHFEVSADLITDSQLELIKKMPEDMIQLEIGVQSTNPKTIEAIRRKMDLDRLKYVVGQLKKYKNVHIHLDLIAGLPYEDLASFKKSFNDVYQMRPSQLQLGFLKVLRGTPISKEICEYEIEYTEYPPYEVLRSKWLPYEDLLTLKMVEQMVEIYYNSGQFGATLTLLEQAFNSPYDLYHKLALFYSEKGYFIATPSRMYRYNVLLEFATRADGKNERMYRQLLTMDAYFRENLKKRPDFAEDQSKYKELFKRINPDRKYHIEVIDKDVSNLLSVTDCVEIESNINEISVFEEEIQKELHNQKLVIVMYEDRGKITNNAKIRMI